MVFQKPKSLGNVIGWGVNPLKIRGVNPAKKSGSSPKMKFGGELLYRGVNPFKKSRRSPKNDIWGRSFITWSKPR